MKKIAFAIFLMAFLSSCGKDPLSVSPGHKIRFSVLGDSYSAFEGYVDPNSNDVWTYSEIGVTEPEQMWWYRLADETKWTMDKNNSFSGSMICNFQYNEYYGPANSFISRMDNLGDPDLVFVFGGTNDAFDGAPLGNYVYDDWSEEQICMFRPGLAYLLSNLGNLYPNAILYLLVDMDLCSGGVDESVRDAYIESMHCVANHYHVKCIDLYRIHKDYWHPNAEGQQDIARQILKAVLGDINA